MIQKDICVSDFNRACALVHVTIVHVQHLGLDTISELSGLLWGAAMRWNKQIEPKYVKKIKVRRRTSKKILCLNAYKKRTKQPVKSAKFHLCHCWLLSKNSLLCTLNEPALLAKLLLFVDCVCVRNMERWNLQHDLFISNCCRLFWVWSNLAQLIDSHRYERVREFCIGLKKVCYWLELVRKVTWSLSEQLEVHRSSVVCDYKGYGTAGSVFVKKERSAHALLRTDHSDSQITHVKLLF